MSGLPQLPVAKPLVLSRPASERDQWQRAGKPVKLSHSFRDPKADGWLWSGPATPETRDLFWHIIKLANPVVFEFMNEAIIGLVWWDGYPVVAYDARKIEDILQAKRGTPDQTVMEHLMQEDDTRMRSMLDTAWGVRTPVFRVG